jgi:hypothetical protein
MKHIHPGLTLSLLLAASGAWAFDDPPADPTLAGDQARAAGEAIKQGAKQVADAAKEGAQQVATAAKEVGHEVASASKEGAQQVQQGAKQVAATAKKGGQQVKATVTGAKPVKPPPPKPDAEAKPSS